ncbi:hypothetical protein EV363DRAFT_220993 [Boletus edulis]|nr:hypothetical protein EV363DRAFT_220993 [Boletus edulis]
MSQTESAIRRRSRKKYNLITRRLREVLGVIKGILAEGRSPKTYQWGTAPTGRLHWILCSIDQDRRFPQSGRRGQSSSRHHLDRQIKTHAFLDNPSTSSRTGRNITNSFYVPSSPRSAYPRQNCD